MGLIFPKRTTVLTWTVFLTITLLVSCTQGDSGDFVETPNGLYDYIIVGAGSAGSVIANRLTEDSDVTVLLVEAGGDDRDVQDISVPGYFGRNLGNSDITKELFTAPQPDVYKSMRNGKVGLLTGRVLGGSSSINKMGYSRGSRHDYDKWAEYTKDESWSYRHVLPYYKKSEKVTSPELKNSQYYGTNGPLSVTNLCPYYRITDTILQGLQDLGYPFNEDSNGEKMGGVSRSQSNVENGERMTSARCYLHPVLHRSNLDVMINTLVSKVVINETKQAEGVELITDTGTIFVRAGKEVILSAGTLVSPQILMLSGVGPRTHLEDLKIKVHSELPVGDNFQDHVFFDLAISIDQPFTPPPGVTSEPWANRTYENLRNGPLAVPESGATFFTSSTDTLREMDWPDIRLLFGLSIRKTGSLLASNYIQETVDELSSRDNVTYGFSCSPWLQRPTSRGVLRLSSDDPRMDPVVTANYYNTPEDVDIVLRGIEICKKLVKTETMSEIGAKLVDTQPHKVCADHKFDTTEYWACVVKSRPLSVSHMSGTCKMGPEDDPTSVVDPQLRVKGIQGLRVADVSVIPFLVTGSTYPTAVMIGEKISDVIRGRQPLPEFVANEQAQLKPSQLLCVTGFTLVAIIGHLKFAML